MFPAAKQPNAPAFEMEETKWLSDIQVMAPAMMGVETPRNFSPFFQSDSRLDIVLVPMDKLSS